MNDVATEKLTPRKEYDFTCPNCSKVQWCHKSMAMECGYNSGHGACLECKTFLHLEIVPDLGGDHAKATDFQEYLKTLPNQKKQ